MDKLKPLRTVSEFVEIYPKKQTDDFLTKPVWRAERNVFKALAYQLEGLWTIYHQAGVHQESKDGTLFRTEIDFICSHLIDGLMVVEVKGGQLCIDNGRWKVRSLKGDGEFKVMKESPTQQAQRGVRCLVERLSEETEIQEALKVDNAQECRSLLKRHVCFAVCFPDLTVKDDLTADLPRKLIIDKEDLAKIEDRLSEILAIQCKPIKGCELPFAIMHVLRRLFAPTITI